jgi:hypothetical protein
MNVPHSGGHRARSQARCMGLAIAVEEEIAPRKRAGCEFPRRVRLCGGGNRLGGSAVAETLDCRHAGWLRLVGRACHAGAILWRSIYRRCSSRAVGSVPESATAATNRRRFSRHQRLRQSEPTSLCQPHLRARAPTKECVEAAPGSSGSPNRARPPPAKQRLGKPGRLGRAAQGG